MTVYTRQVVIWALEQASQPEFKKRKNSGFDAKVLVAICAHADDTGEYAWVGQRKIASIVYGLGLDDVSDSHIRTVRRSVAFLEEQGCLVVRKGAHILQNGRRVNGYALGYAEVEIVTGELVEDVA